MIGWTVGNKRNREGSVVRGMVRIDNKIRTLSRKNNRMSASFSNRWRITLLSSRLKVFRRTFMRRIVRIVRIIVCNMVGMNKHWWLKNCKSGRHRRRPTSNKTLTDLANRLCREAKSCYRAKVKLVSAGTGTNRKKAMSKWILKQIKMTFSRSRSRPSLISARAQKSTRTHRRGT